MTPEEILTKLGIPDANIHETANGEGYHVAVRRDHDGHPFSHSIRIPKDPSDTILEFVKKTFEDWWSETTTP